MKKLLRWLFKPLRQVVFFVRRAQYNLGFRDSKLVYSKQFPDAPYRAVVFGLEEDMWEYFDSAYPEYEKIFAPLNTHIVELRAVLARKKIMLLVFDKAPRRRINTITAGLTVTTYFGSYAPLPILQKLDNVATGFLIDTVAPWIGARRKTEIDIFLENYNLNDRKELIAGSIALQKSIEISKIPGHGCLIIADENEDQTELHNMATATSDTSKHHIFKDHIEDPWYTPEIINRFLNLLQDCDSVVVRDSPLGFIACLAGYNVKVIGRPFWAGYGITTDALALNRRRKLDTASIISIVILLLSRYVNDQGIIIDPTDGWGLPLIERI